MALQNLSVFYHWICTSSCISFMQLSYHSLEPIFHFLSMRNANIGKDGRQSHKFPRLRTYCITVKSQCLLIHSADPQSHSHIHTCRPSEWWYFQNLAKLNKFQVKVLITTGEIVGLAEMIIDDTFLVQLNLDKIEWNLATLTGTSI